MQKNERETWNVSYANVFFSVKATRTSFSIFSLLNLIFNSLSNNILNLPLLPFPKDIKHARKPIPKCHFFQSLNVQLDFYCLKRNYWILSDAQTLLVFALSLNTHPIYFRLMFDLMDVQIFTAHFHTVVILF